MSNKAVTLVVYIPGSIEVAVATLKSIDNRTYEEYMFQKVLIDDSEVGHTYTATISESEFNRLKETLPLSYALYDENFDLDALIEGGVYDVS